ncbi:hypothetical protein L9F63_014274, partial [Diploptera punctata]
CLVCGGEPGPAEHEVFESLEQEVAKTYTLCTLSGRREPTYSTFYTCFSLDYGGHPQCHSNNKPEFKNASGRTSRHFKTKKHMNCNSISNILPLLPCLSNTTKSHMCHIIKKQINYI